MKTSKTLVFLFSLWALGSASSGCGPHQGVEAGNPDDLLGDTVRLQLRDSSDAYEIEFKDEQRAIVSLLQPPQDSGSQALLTLTGQRIFAASFKTDIASSSYDIRDRILSLSATLGGSPVEIRATLGSANIINAATLTVGEREIPVDVLYDFGSEIRDIVPLPDGKILAVGIQSYLGTRRLSDTEETNYATSETFLIRFLANGQLDTSFGGSGIVVENFGFSDRLVQGEKLIQLADGKILVGGTMFWENQPPDNVQAPSFVARYLPNGTRDPDFGTGGLAIASAGELVDMDILSDDRILVSGRGGVTRLLSNGAVDDTFAFHFPSEDTDIHSFGFTVIEALPDDSFLMVADETSGLPRRVLAYRFLPSGEPDLSFGTGGFTAVNLSFLRDDFDYVVFDAPKKIVDLNVFSDGSLLIGGAVSSQGFLTQTLNGSYYMIKLTADGALDTGFGSGGIVSQAIDSSTPIPELPPYHFEGYYEQAIDEDDSIYVAIDNPMQTIVAETGVLARRDSDVRILHRLSNGLADTTFFAEGFLDYDNTLSVDPEDYTYSDGLPIYPDGKVHFLDVPTSIAIVPESALFVAVRSGNDFVIIKHE